MVYRDLHSYRPLGVTGIVMQGRVQMEAIIVPKGVKGKARSSNDRITSATNTSIVDQIDVTSIIPSAFQLASLLLGLSVPYCRSAPAPPTSSKSSVQPRQQYLPPQPVLIGRYPLI